MKELTFQAKIAHQHRVTIPKSTRQMMNLEIGDIVTITIKRESVVSSYP